MSRALVNMSAEDRKNAVGRRLAADRGGLGTLAALDSRIPTRDFGANKGAASKTPRKLSARQQSWRELDRYKGDVRHGAGKRYPEGYRMPGSNK